MWFILSASPTAVSIIIKEITYLLFRTLIHFVSLNRLYRFLVVNYNNAWKLKLGVECHLITNNLCSNSCLRMIMDRCL